MLKIMKAKNIIPVSTFDEYFAGFEKDVAIKLMEMRNTISHAAPKAKEVISYAIPTYVLNGNLVHFAAFKNHIGFYPGPSGIEAFKNELSGYKQAKGSVQFPLNEPLPLETIFRIVKFREAENLNKRNMKIR